MGEFGIQDQYFSFLQPYVKGQPSSPLPGMSEPHSHPHTFPVWTTESTNLVVITCGSLCRPKGVVVGPVAIPLWVIHSVALLTGPAIAHCALPIHVILMHTGHQRPATTRSGHVTEGLVDDPVLRAQEIEAICGENQSTVLLSAGSLSISTPEAEWLWKLQAWLIPHTLGVLPHVSLGST